MDKTLDEILRLTGKDGDKVLASVMATELMDQEEFRDFLYDKFRAGDFDRLERLYDRIILPTKRTEERARSSLGRAAITRRPSGGRAEEDTGTISRTDVQRRPIVRRRSPERDSLGRAGKEKEKGTEEDEPLIRRPIVRRRSPSPNRPLSGDESTTTSTTSSPRQPLVRRPSIERPTTSLPRRPLMRRPSVEGPTTTTTTRSVSPVRRLFADDEDVEPKRPLRKIPRRRVEVSDDDEDDEDDEDEDIRPVRARLSQRQSLPMRRRVEFEGGKYDDVIEVYNLGRNPKTGTEHYAIVGRGSKDIKDEIREGGGVYKNSVINGVQVKGWVVNRAQLERLQQTSLRDISVKRNNINDERSAFVVDYSDKSYAVLGRVGKKLSKFLRELGFKFNPSLSYKGLPTEGYIKAKAGDNIEVALELLADREDVADRSEWEL